ncbi:MAG: hypothetical protein IKQ71_09545 [Lachnospiraceae bacterium]|nr:hypothetical protein [Lachnospiraceae bacterium]
MVKIFSKICIAALPMICTCISEISQFASNECLIFWYQEKEPDGLKEFAQKNKHGKKGKSHNEI